jgi:hypothetical protein
MQKTFLGLLFSVEKKVEKSLQNDNFWNSQKFVETWVTFLIFCMNIVENNVPNEKWPTGSTDGIVQVRFLTFGQKHARNWPLRLPKEGIESNTNNTQNQF